MTSSPPCAVAFWRNGNARAGSTAIKDSTTAATALTEENFDPLLNIFLDFNNELIASLVDDSIKLIFIVLSQFFTTHGLCDGYGTGSNYDAKP